MSKAAVDDFIAYKDKFMQQTVWQQDCRSWYKGNTANGKILALWTGSTLHYVETLKEVRYEDYEIEFFGNRFDYLGNGMTKLEMAPDADLSRYIRPTDDGPIIGSKFVYTKAGPELRDMNMIAPSSESGELALEARL